MKKRLIALLVFIILISVLCLPAFAVAEPSEDFYVADYAGVLSGELEKQICDCNGALEQQCKGAQFVVLTVNYLDGMYSDEYAAEVFREWGIGDAEQNNGVLLLLAVQENKGWLMAGYGIQSRFDADSMMDNRFWNYFDDGKYDKAVERIFKDVLEWFDDEYNVSIYDDYKDYLQGSGQEEYDDYSRGETTNDVFSTIIGAILFLVVMFFIIRLICRVFASIFQALGGGRGGRGGRGGGGFWPWFFFGRAVGRHSRRGSGWNSGSSGWNSGSSGWSSGGHSSGGWSGGGHSGGFGGGSGHGGGGFGGGGGAGRR